MKINVYLERINKYETVYADTISEILQKLKINPQTILITKNNNLITEDAKLQDNDKIKFLSVISGG